MESKRIHTNTGKSYWCIVMEKLDKDWFQEIQNTASARTRYAESVLWERLYVLISTLANLQISKIAHRDIKPSNIFLTNDSPPRVKLADFDSAKVEFNLSSANTLQGTEQYLSPKLYRAFTRKQMNTIHNVFKSDVYSLGVTLVHAASLCMPEPGTRNLLRTEMIDLLPYSERLKSTLRLMLIEEEEDRPDCVELAEWLAVIPSLEVEIPYLKVRSECPQCATSCALVPFVQFPCEHVIAYCSATCMDASLSAYRAQGYVSCVICGQKYRYEDLDTAIPKLRGLFTSPSFLIC
jgi:serine/threonine protein kinase